MLLGVIQPGPDLRLQDVQVLMGMQRHLVTVPGPGDVDDDTALEYAVTDVWLQLELVARGDHLAV